MIQQTPDIQTINGIAYQLDSDIPYTGKLTMYYDDGAKFSESYYKNGKEDGLWVTWDMDGHKCSESNNKDGKSHGIETHWYNNDVISTKGQHHKDKRIGIWRSWHTNGNISHKGEYKNDKKHGLWTYWYSRKTFDNVYSSIIEEQMSSQMHFINGTISGAYVGWHSNGNKEIEVSFKHGLKDGLYIRWHANGQKKVEGKYIANIDKNRQHKTGVWSYWNEGGKLTAKETYREGILIGELV
ncbi:MAG: toxin-antitoxin system YwqK family antitoxin [Gammaproteobacteria bacterium]|nr:toxin-antitoxin system YwqK family antitoxin [Gammaproteobacteria bacterium]